MLQTITTNLSKETYDFIKKISKETKKSNRQVIEEALNIYKQKYLEEQVKKGFEARKYEYKQNIKDFETLQSEYIKG